MQQSVRPAQLVQQGQLCTRVNEWPWDFWVMWKLRCTITQISACLERRKCREKKPQDITELYTCETAQTLKPDVQSLKPNPTAHWASKFLSGFCALFSLPENGNNDTSPTSQKVVRIKPVKVSEALKGIVCHSWLAVYVPLRQTQAPIEQILLDLSGLEPG